MLTTFFITITWTNFIFLQCLAQNPDNYWILMDKVNLFECQGVTNKVKVNKDDISVLDKDGNLALYLQALNDYTVVFENVKMEVNNQNSVGEISSKVYVPISRAGGIWTTVPYDVTPAQNPKGPMCDDESGYITDATQFNRRYCRVCELCKSVGRDEKKLTNQQTLGFQFVKEGKQKSDLGKLCTQTGGSKVRVEKILSVPGKRTVETMLKRNVEPNMQEHFRDGKGRFQLSLQLWTSDTAPVSSTSWYTNRKGCECCVKDEAGNNKCKLNVPGGAWSQFAGTNCQKCNDEYAKNCMAGKPEKTACYTFDFNFRVTSNQTALEEFKKQIDYDNKKKLKNYATVINGGTSR